MLRAAFQHVCTTEGGVAVSKRLMDKVEVKPLVIAEGGKAVKKEIKTAVAAVALAGLSACAPSSPHAQPAPAREAVSTQEKPQWVRDMEALPPVAKPPPLPEAAPAPPPEPSEAILRAREINGTLSPDQLKARIFHYIDSLQRLEDTHIDNIQKQMGLVIPPYEETKGYYSRYFDYLTDGGWMRVMVSHPSGGDPTYGVSVSNLDGRAAPRDTPCRYTVDEFAELLLARGFTDRDWGGRKLNRSFRKRFGDASLSVVMWPYHHYKPDNSYQICVAEVSIGMGPYQE
ncbi:MAG: hypothetical protein Q4G62_09485 [Pseudomonadota bacterium]|nr:hypothetical protein [Pseudomonadota bacterium]